MSKVTADPLQPGTLHRYSPRLVAFEHARPSPPLHFLLWVGGLGDGLLTVSYPALLAEKLPAQWGLVQVMLMSSLNGWGTSALQRDVKELSQCITYFRKLKGETCQVVLMGHSTGCQDAMEYVIGLGHETRPLLHGVILQAPVSDREAMADKLKDYAPLTETAQMYVAQGRGDDVLPLSIGTTPFGRTALSAYRWLSLVSPNRDGDDDYFSSDLPEHGLQKSFGSFKAQTPLLILCSGADEHVPKHIDVSALIKRWTRIVELGGGLVDVENTGIIDGAHHNFEMDDIKVFDDLCQRVNGFLENIEAGRFLKNAQL
jgi:pimeloyl-ACP methyl ester carboxylesterase